MAFFCPNLSNPQVKEEFDSIKNVFGETKAYLIWHSNNGYYLDKTPNGEISKLWKDIKKISNSEEETIRLKGQVYLSEFKSWFGDWINNPKEASKVVDENGEPLVVYHGTPYFGFNEFSKEKLGKNTRAASAKKGFFFANNKKTAREYVKLLVSRDLSEKLFYDFNLEDSGFSDADVQVERFLANEEQEHKTKQRVELERLVFDTINALELGLSNEEELDNRIKEFNEKFAKDINLEKLNRNLIITSYLDTIIPILPKDEYGRPMLKGNYIGHLSFNELQNEIKKIVKSIEKESVYENLLKNENKAYDSLIYSLFLNIKNPKEVDYNGQIKRTKTYNDYLKEASESGNDGVIIKNTHDPTPADIYVSFESNQIKAVTNKGSFSKESLNILKSVKKIPIPPKREVPDGKATALRKKYGINKIKLLPQQDTNASNIYIKEVDKLFNLTSVRDFPDGTKYKFFNPLTIEEAKAVEAYMKKYYEDYEIERVRPWTEQTQTSGWTGLKVTGHPVNTDQQELQARKALQNKKFPFFNRKEDDRSVEDRRIEHVQKIENVVSFIEGIDKPVEVLQHIKDNNLLSDPTLRVLLDLFLDNENKDLKIEVVNLEDYPELGDAYMALDKSDFTIKVIYDAVIDLKYGDFNYFVRKLMHEFLHGYSTRIINDPQTELEREFGKNLTKMMKATKSRFSKELQEKYKKTAFESEDEFLSYLMEDDEFISDVRKNDKYNWWQRFLNWLADLIGYDRLNNPPDRVQALSMIMNVIPDTTNYTYLDQGTLQAKLKDKIYTLRDKLNIKKRDEFESNLREFEKDFKRVKDIGTVYSPQGEDKFVIFGVNTIMNQYGFEIDPEELKKNEKLEEALERANSIGTVVHGTIESILRGQKADLRNSLGFSSTQGLREGLKPLIDKFKGQKVTLIPELWVTDLRKGIGGRIDLVVIDEKNKIHLYDFKTKERGFDTFDKRYTNTVDGFLKFSANMKAHAQLTLYKNIFESMTGYAVTSVNVVKIKPEVNDDSKKITGISSFDIERYDGPSQLGEDIYSSLSNEAVKYNKDLLDIKYEDGVTPFAVGSFFKTHSYKEMGLNKEERVLEDLIKALEDRLRVAKKNNKRLEAKELEEHLEKVRSQKDAVESIKAILSNGLRVSGYIMRDYTEAKKKGRRLTIGQFHYWRDFISGYDGFVDYLQYLNNKLLLMTGNKTDDYKRMQEMSIKVTKLNERVLFIKNLYAEEGLDQLVDFIAPFYNKERVDEEHTIRKEYRKLSEEEKKGRSEDEYIRDIINDPNIKAGIESRTRHLLRDELKKATRDIGTLTLWLDNVMDSKDPVVAAMVKAFAFQDYQTHHRALDVRSDIVNNLREFEKQRGVGQITDYRKTYDFMLEDGTQHIVSRFNSTLFTEYKDLVMATNFLTEDKLKEIIKNEDKIYDEAVINTTKHWLGKLERTKVEEEKHELFEKAKDDIRKTWKDHRTIFFKEAFKADKHEFMESLIEDESIEFTEHMLAEIVSNDEAFVRGESEAGLMDLANDGTISAAAANAISSWIFRHAWDYRELRPEWKAKYESKKYEAIMAMDKDDPRRKLYNLLSSLMEEANNVLPYASRIGYRLPGVRKSAGERMRAGQNLAKQFVNRLKEDFTVVEDDIERDNKQLFTENGKPRYFLPLHYLGEVEEENQSYDLPTIVFKFWQNAIDFSNKLEILPEMELAKFMINNRTLDPSAKTGLIQGVKRIFSKEDLKNYNNNLAKQINEWFMTNVYGMPKREQGKFKIAGKEVDTVKLIDAINSYTSLNLLGLNVVQGVANTLLGEVLQTAERIAGEYMSKSAYRKGTEFYIRNVPGIMDDVGRRNPKNVVSHLIEWFDTLDENVAERLSQVSKIRRLANKNSLFFTTHAGEHEMQGRFLLSMLYDKQAYDKDGNHLGSMLHQYKVKDGKLVLNEKVDREKSEWTLKDEFNFKYKVNGILSRLHGEYSDLGRAAIQRGAMGRMAFMFRKFVVPGWKRRWGSKDYIERLGDYVEGGYISTGRFMGALLKDLIHLKFDINNHWHEMSDHEKANVKRTLTEVSFFIVAVILANFAIAKMKDIDDEDDERYWAFLAYQAVRLKAELAFFISPPAAYDILRSPMASMSVIENLTKLVRQLTTEPLEKFERGPWKDQAKINKYITNMMPAYRQWYRVRDIHDQLAWFSQRVN